MDTLMKIENNSWLIANRTALQKYFYLFPVPQSQPSVSSSSPPRLKMIHSTKKSERLHLKQDITFIQQPDHLSYNATRDNFINFQKVEDPNKNEREKQDDFMWKVPETPKRFSLSPVPPSGTSTESSNHVQISSITAEHVQKSLLDHAANENSQRKTTNTNTTLSMKGQKRVSNNNNETDRGWTRSDSTDFRYETKNQLYKCDQVKCGQSFPRLVDFLQHDSEHVAQRARCSYYCPWCSYSACQFETISEHICRFHCVTGSQRKNNSKIESKIKSDPKVLISPPKKDKRRSNPKSKISTMKESIPLISTPNLEKSKSPKSKTTQKSIINKKELKYPNSVPKLPKPKRSPIQSKTIEDAKSLDFACQTPMPTPKSMNDFEAERFTLLKNYLYQNHIGNQLE